MPVCRYKEKRSKRKERRREKQKHLFKKRIQIMYSTFVFCNTICKYKIMDIRFSECMDYCNHMFIKLILILKFYALKIATV